MTTSLLDVSAFRRDAHALVDQLADYLSAASAGAMPVLPKTTPDAMLAAWPASAITDEPQSNLRELVSAVLASSNHLHHPRFVGHQVTAPLPEAALLAMVGALLNNGMAVFDMGPVSSAMERSALRWMSTRLGFPDAAEGVLTSGGSLGNLTALLAARAAAEASQGEQKWAVVVSDQAHYSVARAARVMGWGEDGVVLVPADEHFRMRADRLPLALGEAKRRGREVVAVVGSACSTATGAFDPLDEIADFCERERLWMHVDGAHGASFILSEKHRGLLRGIDRADSVVWDAHKMLLVPALVTAVLFRDGRRSYATFAQKAAYLFADGGEPPWFDIGMRTLECTKRMMSLELYGALLLRGASVFADYVTSRIDVTRAFAQAIEAAPDFELALAPECNIICFRHLPAGRADLDEHQRRLRRAVVESGAFYLVETKLPRGVFLRLTVIHPDTSGDDLAALLDVLRAAAS